MAKAAKKWAEVGAQITEKIKQSEGFSALPRTSEGQHFFTFSKQGDFLVGTLGVRRTNQEIHRTVSYRIEVDEICRNGQDEEVALGQVEEFFANRQLQQIITASELSNAYIKIVYVGRCKGPYMRRTAKVYEVFKVKGLFRKVEVRCDAKTRKSKAKRK